MAFPALHLCFPPSLPDALRSSVTPNYSQSEYPFPPNNINAFSLSVGVVLEASASSPQAGIVPTLYRKALDACNSSINKLVGAPAFLSSKQYRNQKFKRKGEPDSYRNMALTSAGLQQEEKLKHSQFLPSRSVSCGHICECNYGISSLARQGCCDRLAPILLYSSIYRLLHAGNNLAITQVLSCMVLNLNDRP